MDAIRLQESSRRWMATGLEAFSSGEESFDFAVHHHGVALEHLLKAYLASLHPALIVEPKDFDSMLHATGHSDRAKRPSTRSKTIGLFEAFVRVKKLLPDQITVTEQEFEPVLAARNGVAHAGHHDPSESRQVLTTCMRIADSILGELGAPLDEYWGDYGNLHRQLIDKHVNELKVAVHVKLARAKAIYQRRVKDLVNQQRIEVVAKLSNVSMFPSNIDVQIDCPACEGQGWLHGTTVAHEIDDFPSSQVTVYCDSYDCSLCGLILEGEELSAAGISRKVKTANSMAHTWPQRRGSAIEMNDFYRLRRRNSFGIQGFEKDFDSMG